MHARRPLRDAAHRAARLMMAGSVLFALAWGCESNSGQGTEVYSQFTEDIQAQLASVESVAAGVQKGIDETNLRLDGMDAEDAQLAETLARGNARPGEVKTEILEEVDRQIAEFMSQQEFGAKRLELQLEAADTTLNQALKSRYDPLHARLVEEERFLQFFYHEQDSVNRILASRIDRKPWYDSILSGWKGSSTTSKP